LAPSLTANIRLGWKLQAVANTLAYSGKELITTVKRFIVQAAEFSLNLEINDFATFRKKDKNLKRLIPWKNAILQFLFKFDYLF
jgi:hypothetical protein